MQMGVGWLISLLYESLKNLITLIYSSAHAFYDGLTCYTVWFKSGSKILMGCDKKVRKRKG